jgi:putative transposase
VLKTFVAACKTRVTKILDWLEQRLQYWTQPIQPSLILDALSDLRRGKSELVLENALLRQQLIVLKRSVKRPKLTDTDRRLLVVLSSRLPSWESALLLVKPETLLHWHRQLFKRFWRRKSRGRVGRPKLSAEVIALIKQMALDNRLWGAERIRGELLKLDIHVCKRTIQKYMRQVRRRRQSKQTWTTFLHNHAQAVWCATSCRCSIYTSDSISYFSLSSWLHGVSSISGSPTRRATLG